MGALMITCPKTGQPISTGIETDEYSLKQIDDVPTRTRYPFCGLDHVWWKREAWLTGIEQPLRKPLDEMIEESSLLRSSDVACGSIASEIIGTMQRPHFCFAPKADIV